MADAGKLYGDLYKVLRYQGGETYTKHVFDYDEQNRIVGDVTIPDAIAIGGEPVLSEEAGWYVETVSVGDTDTYQLATAPYPSLCVQPVADYAKWGDISSVTGLSFNRLPLVITYDATWTRSECEVGNVVAAEVDSATGELVLDVDPYFVPPCADVLNHPEECTWNGVVYCDGVTWTDMVDEVSFGRLNLSRAPEAVLQAAFDEAITSINNAVEITRDAAGRLLLTTELYAELTTGTDSGDGLMCTNAYLGTVTKAIDSPLQNLALYVKLLKDGHLVTPGVERQPIDRSERGGIPIWKLLELSDGPSAALRPTVDISKLSAVFDGLVDVVETEYYTYYDCYDEAGQVVDCLCDAIGADGQPVSEACEDVVSRELVTVAECPDPTWQPNAASCEGPWLGIERDDADGDGVVDYSASGADFEFAAAFLGAAADKTGDIGLDMIVYLNSILGINRVVGYSEVDAEGNPTPDAIDYSRFPVYFDFSAQPPYERTAIVGSRGDAGKVTVLQPGSTPGTWIAGPVDMLEQLTFHDLGVSPGTGHPSGAPATLNALGFAQMADDDLSIIEFVHTYQIPELR